MHKSSVTGDAFLLHRCGVNRRSPSPLLSLLVILAGLLINADCAKVGEPQPPILVAPKPAADLAARQYGDSIMITVSLPTQNTDGSPVTALHEVEVLRVSATRGAITAPLQGKDFLARADVILSASGDTLAPFVREKSFGFRDEPPPGQPAVFYSETLDYAVRFTNRKKQTAGLSNQVIISPLALPAPPAGITAKLTQDYVLLTWSAPVSNADGSTPPRAVGYNVYRSEDPKKFPPAPLNPVLLPKPEYEDRSFQFDKTYYYVVSIVGSLQDPYAESSPSQLLQVVTRDTFPPGPPENLNPVAEGATVILLWAAPADPDVAGYRVYRSTEGGKERQALQAVLIQGLSYRDGTVQAGRRYEYFVTAVDARGNESAAARTTVEIP
jgi:hypothetical protein